MGGSAMLNKLMSPKWIVLIFGISLATSCGGGGGGNPGGGGSCGGGADCVSFAFDGGATTVRTETYDPWPPTLYDPYITSSYASGSSLTSITAKYGYNGVGYNETLYISFFGNTVGPYSVSLGSFTYTSASPLASYTSTGTGEINVSAYEGTGGHIQGSFDVTVCTVATTPCPNGSTKQMTGTFYVTRLFL
jgi:hypothetical protein